MVLRCPAEAPARPRLPAGRSPTIFPPGCMFLRQGPVLWAPEGGRAPRRRPQRFTLLNDSCNSPGPSGPVGNGGGGGISFPPQFHAACRRSNRDLCAQRSHAEPRGGREAATQSHAEARQPRGGKAATLSHAEPEAAQPGAARSGQDDQRGERGQEQSGEVARLAAALITRGAQGLGFGCSNRELCVCGVVA